MIFGEEPKIICMVRDLRQILSSLEKKFRQNPDKYRPVENHANLSGTTTLKRVLLGLQSPPVGLALPLAKIEYDYDAFNNQYQAHTVLLTVNFNF